jgi:putative ABC transport system ATP-binding protein
MKEAIKYGNRIIQLKEGKIVNDLNAKQKESLTINDLVDWF